MFTAAATVAIIVLLALAFSLAVFLLNAFERALGRDLALWEVVLIGATVPYSFLLLLLRPLGARSAGVGLDSPAPSTSSPSQSPSTQEPKP